MIQALKSSSIVISVCCIVCSMLSVIAPMGRMKKTVDIVLSVFLLSSMIIPIVSVLLIDDTKIEISEQAVDMKQIDEQSYEELVLKQTADNLVDVTANILKTEGIEVENIILSLKKTDKNSIYISKIDIYINKAYEDKINKIKSIISSNMSKEPEIYVNE